MTWIWQEEFAELDRILTEFGESVKNTFHAATDIGGHVEPDLLGRSLAGFRAVEEAMKEFAFAIDDDPARRLMKINRH